MSTITQSRTVALSLCLALLLASIPQSAWGSQEAARRAPATAQSNSRTGEALSRTAERLFEGETPNASGHLQRRFEIDAFRALTYFYADGRDAFRKRIRVDVPEGTGQLHLTVLRGGITGRVRVRLIDPDGEVLDPGRSVGNEYDEIARLEDKLRRGAELRRVAGADLGEGSLYTPLSDEAVGTFGGSRGADLFVNLQAPRAGRWRLIVDSDSDDSVLVGVAVLEGRATAQLRAGACCEQIERAGCFAVATLAFGTLKILVVGAAAALFTKIAVAGVVTYGVAQLAVLISDVALDWLLELGFINRELKKALNILGYVEGVLAATVVAGALAGVPIAAALGVVGDILSRPFIQDLAREFCRLWSDEKFIGFAPGFAAYGFVDERYRHVVEVVDPGGKYTIKLTKGRLPDGIELDESSGELAGTPTEAGTYDFTLRAEGRSAKNRADKDFSIVIYEDPGNSKAADLVIFTLELDEITAKPGDRVTIDVEMRNQGGVASEAGTLMVVLSQNKKWAVKGGLVGIFNYESLPGQESVEYRLRPIIPGTVPRGSTLFVGAIADTDNTTKEKNPKGGNGEKNNIEWAEITMVEKAPYDVVRPSKGDVLEPGERVDIRWQNDGSLSNVNIELWQHGQKVTRIWSGSVGNGNERKWTVPDNRDGTGYTIQVVQQGDTSVWAESGIFSIGTDATDLTGRWDLDREVTLFIEGSATTAQASGAADFLHNLKREELEIRVNGVLLGKWDAADGRLEATHIQGTIRNWSGNLLNHPGFVRMNTNTGSYSEDRMSSTVEFVVDVGGGVGEATFTLVLSGTRR